MGGGMMADDKKFWTVLNDGIAIIEPTGNAADEYGHLYGSELICLTPEHIKALQDGKQLAWNNVFEPVGQIDQEETLKAKFELGEIEIIGPSTEELEALAARVSKGIKEEFLHWLQGCSVSVE